MRRVIVTGGSRGLGLGIVRRLVCEGYAAIAVAPQMNDQLASTIEHAERMHAGSLQFVAFDLANQGNVASSPQGVDCGGDCWELYRIDAVVTLTASPDLLFSGWTGRAAVSGATCTVPMSAVRNVTANFVSMPF